MKLTKRQLRQLIHESLNDNPGVVYHGSSVLFNGPVEPRQAVDLSGRKTGNLNAVYASKDLNFVISMGMVEKGSSTFAAHGETPYQLVLVEGDIRYGQEVYVYVLPEQLFDNTGKPDLSPEWVSKNPKPIQPIKVLKFKVDDYLHLIRHADKKDMKFWCANAPDSRLC